MRDAKKIVYRKLCKCRYQLLKDYHIRLDKRFKMDKVITDFIYLRKDGWLTIKKYYVWDGPSGPTIDTPSFMRGSLVHDALYQMMRTGLLSIDYRNWTDRWLKKICLDDGMYGWRAEYVYFFVDKGAGKHALPQPEYKVLTAP